MAQVDRDYINSIAQTVLKKGDHTSTYTIADVTYGDVDATNLGYTVVIPLGYNLLVYAQGRSTVGGGGTSFVAISDGGTPVAEDSITVTNQAWKVTALIAGDGASHVITLQSKYVAAAGVIANATATTTVAMACVLVT